jgi:uroporphyrinogen III methyltransferase/synthase
VVETVDRRGVTPPAVFVVGSVVDRAPVMSWFTARPLFGKTVLVTGSHGTSEKLRDRLSTLGAAVIFQPAIRITEPPDWVPVDAAIGRLGEYDWLAFSSANGVDYLLRRIFLGGGDARLLGGVRLAAMGTGTADRLACYGLRADVIPDEFVAEALAEALVGEAKDRRFLLARASRGRSVLAETLRGAGGAVDEIVVYGSVDVEAPDPGVAAELASGGIDWITVMSSATAGSLDRLYGGNLGRARLASIGPLASAGLRALGLEPTVEASPHSIDGLVDALLAFVREQVP